MAGRALAEDAPKTVVITVSPTIVYPDRAAYSFTIAAPDLPADAAAAASALLIDGIPIREIQTAPGSKLPTVRVSAGRWDYSGITLPHQAGSRQVQVILNGNRSAAIPITFSSVGRMPAVGISLIVTLVVIGVVIALVKNRLHHDVGARRIRGLRVLLIDRATDTYSLSMLQTYMWGMALVFIAIYMLVCKSLIFGTPMYPDLPEQAIGLFALSLGTSVGAGFVASARGPKGAGDVHPALSDLVTSGGAAAPDRMQFFVWTLLGVGSFLFITLVRDPAELQNLPEMPDTFLYLMGASSLGYLGGKFVRKGGPVIDEIIAAKQQGTLQLELRGRGFSLTPGLKIDGEEVPFDTGRLPLAVQPAPGKIAVLEAKANSDGGNDQSTSLIKVLITKPNGAWLAGTHRLVLINDDGQQASWEFEAK